MAKAHRLTVDRLWRGGRLSNHFSRLRHARGHGVHSPYIYSIVRSVYMHKRSARPQNMELYAALQLLGIKSRVAIELSAMAAHCTFGAFAIDEPLGGAMIICSSNCSEHVIEEAAVCGMAIVIMSPYKRMELCNKLLKAHKGASIDKFSYLLLLNNHLPKQHYRL